MEYQEEWIFKVIWINLHITVLTMISLPMLRSDSTVSPVEAGAWRLCRGSLIQWNLDITKGQLPKGLAKFVRYKEVLLYRSSFPYVLILLGWRKPRRSLYRGLGYMEVLLHRGLDYVEVFVGRTWLCRRSLYRWLCYVEVRYIKVPLYQTSALKARFSVARIKADCKLQRVPLFRDKPLCFKKMTENRLVISLKESNKCFKFGKYIWEYLIAAQLW